MAQHVNSLTTLVAAIADGARLAIAPDYSGVALAATRALIARGVRDLHLIAVPQAGLQVDWLIGAGAVHTVEAAGINLGEFGRAPRFTQAVETGRIRMLDATCPAIYAGLQAAEKGIPCMPLRGILGSDLLRVRPDWRVIDNPYGQNDPLVLIPAIQPDIALFHAPFADVHGNVWIGTRRELMLMAHAARRTLVTVEEIREVNLLADPVLAAGTIPALYITQFCAAVRGAWPLGLFDTAERGDHDEIARYAKAAITQAGFDTYMREAVREVA